MNNEIHDLINNNYQLLHDKFCKYNRNVIINGKTSEDLFNDRILSFIELNIDNPTIELLNVYMKIKRKNKKSNKNTNIQFIDYLTTNTDVMANSVTYSLKIKISKYTESCIEYNKLNMIKDNLKYLFIDKN